MTCPKENKLKVQNEYPCLLSNKRYFIHILKMPISFIVLDSCEILISNSNAIDDHLLCSY